MNAQPGLQHACHPQTTSANLTIPQPCTPSALITITALLFSFTDSSMLAWSSRIMSASLPPASSSSIESATMAYWRARMNTNRAVRCVSSSCAPSTWHCRVSTRVCVILEPIFVQALCRCDCRKEHNALPPWLAIAGKTGSPRRCRCTFGPQGGCRQIMPATTHDCILHSTMADAYAVRMNGTPAQTWGKAQLRQWQRQQQPHLVRSPGVTLDMLQEACIPAVHLGAVGVPAQHGRPTTHACRVLCTGAACVFAGTPVTHILHPSARAPGQWNKYKQRLCTALALECMPHSSDLASACWSKPPQRHTPPIARASCTPQLQPGREA